MLWISQKALVLMVIMVFVLLISAIIISFSGSKDKTKDKDAVSVIPVPVSSSSSQNKTFPAPSVFFEKYTNNSSTPTEYSKLVKNNGINVYSFKSNFSDSEVAEFVKDLGLTGAKNSTSSADYVIAYNFSNTAYDENPKLANDRGMLTFNKLTGSFDYQSFGVKTPKGYKSGQDAKLTAASFLSSFSINNTKLADSSLVCDITYQRKDLPDTTFVECHRNWEKIGLPIYNFIGILNVSENTNLSSLKLGSVDSNSPEDKSVTSVTMNGVKTPAANGKIRPNDFNTVTVAVNNTDGRILSVSSNLRWIESEKSQPLTNLLTPDEALKQFMDHKSDLSLTIPAGSGTIDWGKIYQNNQAHAKEAIITEHLLSYLENPPSVKQSYLTPMYTIRGYATLDTGFRVNFIQTVPALKDNVLGAATENSQLIAESPDSIQLGVYDPANPSPPVNSPGQPGNNPQGQDRDTTGIVRGDPNYFKECRFVAGTPDIGIVKVDIPNLGTVNFAVILTDHLIMLSSITAPISDMNQIRKILWELVEEQYSWNVIKHVTEQNLNWPSTLDDMYNLFNQINIKIDAEFRGGVHENPSYPAPDAKRFLTGTPDSIAGEFGGTYDNVQLMRQIVKNVAEKLLKDHSINRYRNIFPYPMNNRGLPFFFSIWPSTGVEFGKCYVAGTTSPSLFIYSAESIKTKIQITDNWIYADPIPVNNNFIGIAYPSGSFISADNNTIYPYLYYEYDSSKVSFNKPTTGFSVKFNNWQQTVENIADRFGLNSKEKDRLVLEVKNELYGKPITDYLTISIIDPKELDSKLPLSITPNPTNIFRIHLSLAPSTAIQTLPQPNINPIKRTDFYAVEIGARYGK